MVEFFKRNFIRYRSMILYLVFGVLTTFVNVFTYWLLAHPMHLDMMLSTVLAWIAAVFFAFFTNRKWVFESKTSDSVGIAKEIVRFFSCRLATGLVDMAIMFIFVDVMAFSDVVIKMFANVVVIVLNFVASKFFVFKKEKQQDGDNQE